MSRLAVIAVVLLLTGAQARDPSTRELLNNPRPLTEREIASIVSLSQDALTDQLFSLTWIGRTDGGPNILMGSRAQPRIIHWAGEMVGGIVGGVVNADGTAQETPPIRWRGPYITITDFTGRPAVRCGDSTPQGELVVEYKLQPPANQWNVTARVHRAGDLVGGPGLAPVFEMLQGTRPLSSGERRRINGRWARAFVSSWTPAQPTIAEPVPLIGDPIPNVKGEPIPRVGVQTLWIDVETLLPLRWEAAFRSLSGHGFDFRYGAEVPRPPAGLAIPECVQ